MNLTITVDVCKHRRCLIKKPVQLQFDIRQRITRTPVHTVAELLGFSKYSWTNWHKCRLHITYRSVGGSLSVTDLVCTLPSWSRALWTQSEFLNTQYGPHSGGWAARGRRGGTNPEAYWLYCCPPRRTAFTLAAVTQGSDRYMFMNSNPRVPVKKEFAWSAVVSCACELALLVAAVCCLIAAVRKFDCRIVINSN